MSELCLLSHTQIFRCNHVLKDVNDSYEALTMDGELQAPEELMAVVRREEAKEEKGVCVSVNASVCLCVWLCVPEELMAVVREEKAKMENGVRVCFELCL